MQQLENRTWWLPTLFMIQLDDLAKSVKSWFHVMYGFKHGASLLWPGTIHKRAA
jgi:hypothetical protein